MKECDRCTAPHVVVLDYTLHLCGLHYLAEMQRIHRVPLAKRKRYETKAAA